MKSVGFVKNQSDLHLLSKRDDGTVILNEIHVDDCLVIGKEIKFEHCLKNGGFNLKSHKI